MDDRSSGDLPADVAHSSGEPHNGPNPAAPYYLCPACMECDQRADYLDVIVRVTFDGETTTEHWRIHPECLPLIEHNVVASPEGPNVD